MTGARLPLEGCAESRRHRLVWLWPWRGALALLLLVPLTPLLWRVETTGGLGAARSKGPTMVVADVSGSISPALSNAFARTLASLSADDPSRRAGLVIFSDGAQLVMPPTVPARDLARFSRYFVTRRATAPDATARAARAAIPGMYPAGEINPWANAWLGGTAIAKGLIAADRALGRTRGGTVILVSDLRDGEAAAALGKALTALTAHGRDLVIVPAGAGAGDIATYTSRGAAVVERPRLASSATHDRALSSGYTVDGRARAVAAILVAAIVAGLAWWQAPLILRAAGASR